jgi:osmotically-inducible protein OsmY
MLRWQGAAVAGLVAAVVLTALAILLEAGGIEKDLSERAAAALEGEATSWATVTVEGRDAALEGAAPAQELLDLASVRVARLFGVRSVDLSAATLLPEESPYVITLSRNDDTVLVGGYAPSDPERRRILAHVAATLPDLGTADALDLARGLPDKGYLEALTRLVPVVADLANGRVMLRDRTATVEGEAISNEAYDRLSGLDVELPDGYALDPPDVVRPVASPYRISAAYRDGRVVLEGFAPDDETRTRIADTASAEGRLPVESRLDLASGEPPGFTAAVLASLDFLDLFSTGRVDVTDRRLSLSGTAATPESWRTLNSHLATFRPDGFVVDVDVGLPVVTPFVLTAIRDGSSVTVTGFAPSGQAVDEIRRIASQVAEEGRVVVETTLAAGAPQDFTAAATFAVRLLDHLGKGTVVLADDRISISGIASSSGDLLELEASIALEAPEGYGVDNAVQPPVVSPYSWSIERTADSVVISGFVPSEAVRVAVRDAADDAAGDLAVTDRTALAAGLPDGVDLAAIAAFAAAEIALLDEGRIDLLDRTLSLEGRTEDALAGRSAEEAFDTQLPVGVRKGTVSIATPTPFRFKVSRAVGSVIVDGAIPDVPADGRLREATRRLFGPSNAYVLLTPSEMLPPGAEGVATIALRIASELAEGSVTITDGDVAVNGVAHTARSRQRILDDLAALPDGYAGRETVALPPARSLPGRTDPRRGSRPPPLQRPRR